MDSKVCFLSSRHEGEEPLLSNEERDLWGPNQELADFPKVYSQQRGRGWNSKHFKPGESLLWAPWWTVDSKRTEPLIA